MRDLRERYLLIRSQFPNKAGELLRLVTAQKRLIHKLSKQKQTQEVKELLIASSEAYDVTLDLLEWTKQIMQGVCDDATALADGSEVRNQVRFQSMIIDEYLNRHDKDILEVVERAKAKGYEPKV